MTGKMDGVHELMLTKHRPEGFEVVESALPDRLEVVHRTHGMGCLMFFLGFGVVALGSGLALAVLFDPAGFWESVCSEWWTPYVFGCGLAALFYFGFFVLFHVYGSTEFVATQDALLVVRRLFWFRTRTTIRRDRMSGLVQVQDGGRRGDGDLEDSFPSWGLHLRAKRTHRLLVRQTFETSAWLGEVFAVWFGLPFECCEMRREGSSESEGGE